ncbi:MAG: bifunctional diaminohydroxyphosphoribosylaminopyrimidine deaminase/5-amino-6-(5-phosphoribosylamino)uracil reductase RibD [Congregibacter sp.]
MFSGSDHHYMSRALRLAARARFWARPNPHVGCVLVRDDQIVGEGFTQPAGGDHAEVSALRLAGNAAHGATAYVTLEPCSHHGRTPPCTDALIGATIARVVYAVADPNPKVNGRGLTALSEAGIEVQSGLLADLVETQLAGFLLRQRRGRGRVRAKLAMSLDGRTAMASGESQWITGPAARADVQRLRAESCAIVTGVDTVLADDCALTVRDAYFSGELLPPPEKRALRVVADAQLRTPENAAVLAGEQPSLIAHAADAAIPGPLQAVHRLPLARSGPRLDLNALLAALANRECNDILLESGPTLAGALLTTGMLDQLIIYLAPKLLGSRARPLFELPLDEMANAFDLTITDQRRIGEDVRFTLKPASQPVLAG